MYPISGPRQEKVSRVMRICPGLANSFSAMLKAAADARARGNCQTAANNYRAFINGLQAQLGKGVDAGAAQIMIADAQYLIAHCP